MANASLNAKALALMQAAARPAPRSAAVSGKRSNPLPAIPFRSALIKAQNRYTPAQKVAPPATRPSEEQNSAVQAVTATAASTSAAPAAATTTASTSVTPASPASPTSKSGTAANGPMALADFPRPAGDNGRGMHWVPTAFSSTAVVDRFVKEAKEMKIKWMVILNNDTELGANDYLVKQLVENGIEPIMRIYTPNGNAIKGDVEALVRHYLPMGVDYYQIYNEPNLNVENPDGVPNVDRYVDMWLSAAKAVTQAGGLPGIGALSPGGNFDDYEFLKQMLDKIKERGETASLDRAWLALHNYTLNHPTDYMKDSNGFMKFKWYDTVVREKLGRQMPIISTEGGTHVGSADDRTFPAIDEAAQVRMVTEAYKYMKNTEPYYFAYTYWIIANEEGGGADPAFTNHALFKPGYRSPLVDALKALA